MCLVEGLGDAVVAGVPTRFLLRARDEFGNFTKPPSSAWSVALYDSTNLLVRRLRPVEEGAVSVTLLKAGAYWLRTAFEGHLLPQPHGKIGFTVVAAAPSLQNCLLLPLPPPPAPPPAPAPVRRAARAMRPSPTAAAREPDRRAAGLRSQAPAARPSRSPARRRR